MLERRISRGLRSPEVGKEAEGLYPVEDSGLDPVYFGEPGEFVAVLGGETGGTRP